MNRIYRLVWNSAAGTMVAVAENATGRGKSGTAQGLLTGAVALTGLAGCLLLTPWVHAAPVGGQVTAGTGSVAQSGATTTITQSSQNLSLSWQSFNVAAQEKVNFVQPSASAIAVNRIYDTNGSQILGQLNANGQVYLINPNGVLFGAGAQVNVGGLVASTLDLSDASLNSSTRSFSGTGTGSVVNQGSITAASGGYVALLGNTVSNTGQITAQLGTIALGAGSAATLTFAGNSLVALQIDQSTLNNLAENQQLLQADGGTVLMSAGARDALLASVVNNTGIIEARTVDQHNGSIVLLGGMAAGTVQVAGTLDASAPNGGNGGFIETSAAHVQVADTAQITTAAASGSIGTWLIDPVDFTIAAAGGDITGTALGSLLDSNSITIQTATGSNTSIALYGSTGSNGDIYVNDAVSWSGNTTLTLNAWRNININQSITATGSSGKLALQYGQGASDGIVGGVTSTYNVNAPVNLQAGQNFSTQMGTAGTVVNYTVLTSLGLEGSTGTTDLQGMSGNLAGNYVLGANIDASATSSWESGAGFAPVGNSSTKFTGIFDGLGHTVTGLTINRTGTDYVGLFGYALGAAIRNVGLVGGSVSGYDYVGGLAGYNYNGGTVSNSYTTGSVSGNRDIGGLVGANDGTVSDSYATGNVSAIENLGGLVGFNYTGTVSNSYATGSVNGTGFVGGLVGVNYSTISNSYATSSVNGVYQTGGLVGYNDGTISNNYATGSVNGTSAIGGLVGRNDGTISNSYWDSYSTGQANAVGLGSSSGATAVTSDPTQSAAPNYAFKASTYAGLDFATTWFMVDGSTRPFLQSEYSQTITNAHQLQLMAMNLAASYTLALDIDATETGTASSRRAGMWSSAGFAPVGNSSTAFSGIFDGLGHTVTGLTINRPTTNDIGLFGYAQDSTIRNVGLVGGSVNGRQYVGGLVGENYAGTISNSYATGNVSGLIEIGGLVGANYAGTISNSYAMGSVSGLSNYTGGLVGLYIDGTISNSYATGSVSGANAVGGLAGGGSNGTISNSYATGNVSGTGDGVGGLVGANYGGAISNSYAMGSVSGASGVGGLVGENYGTVTNSFWNTTTSGQTTSAGGTGLTTAQMMSVSSFTGWDIASTGGSNAVWRIYEGQTAPLLRSFLTALTLGDTTAVYNGTTQNGATNSTAGVLGTAASGRNAGTYAGYYSSQQGYDIIGGDLTITPATLTYTATPTTLPTGQTPSGLGGTVSGFVGGETLASATTGSLGWSTPAVASSQPGQYAINGSGLSSSNYVLAQASGNATALTLNVAAVVQPAPITPSQPVLDTVALLESRTLPVAPETYSSTPVSAAMNFNGTGASPNIVQPGIRLPARMDAENE